MQLHALFVEDSEDDVLLVLRELERLGFEIESERVETAEAMRAALADREWNLIICDYSLPSFNAPQALEVLKASGKDIPFIILSGTIGEETAVAVMKAGAHDFLLKDNLTRLGPVIERELREAAVRHERRLAEAALAASEAQLRALFASMEDLVFVVDRDGIYKHIAPTHTELLIAAPQELLNKSFYEVLPRQRAEEFMRAIARALDTRETAHIEYWLTINNRQIWLEASITPMNENDTLWVVRDITDRKHAEEALANSEKRFRALIENGVDYISLLSADGRLIWESPSTTRMLGYEENAFLGENILRIIHPEDFRWIQPRLSRLAERPGSQEHAAFRLRHRDGSWRWVEAVVTNLLNDPSVQAIVVNYHDVTERKQAEEFLKMAEERYRSTLANMMEGCQIIDFDWRYIYVNEAAARQGHSTPQDLLMRTMMEAYPGIEDTELFRVLQKCMSERTSAQLENEFRFPDGTTGWFELAIQPVAEGLFILSIDITERKKAEQAVQENLTELKMLYESGLTLNQLLNPKEIAQKLIDLMITKLDWHHVAVRLYHPENEILELLAFSVPGAADETERRALEERLSSLIVRLGDGLSGWAAQHRQAVRVGDLARDARYVEVIPGLHSGLYIPLQMADHLVGVISVESEKPDAFSEADERFASTLANQAAIAIENARLHEETIRQVQQLQALHAIDLAISSSFDQQFTLDIVLEHSMKQLDADAACIFLVQPFQQTLKLVVAKGFYGNAFGVSELKMGNSFAGRAVLERRVIHINNSEQAGETAALAKVWTEEGFQSQHIIPLIAKGEVHGVLIVYFRKPFTPDQAWLNLFETLAGQAAIAIDNTKMFEGLQRANMELAVAYDATIEGWSQAMDLRDKETEGHTQRVTRMAVELAKAMGMNEEELVHVRRGALLHDIGKIGVPDPILLKPDKLTDKEWRIMKQHPQFAYDMLSSISYLRRAVEIPYCHHEKWDGSGYPRGLKGEQIPLAARIFAVADVWDAVTSDRPYRKAWSKEEALKYIREQSGKHFDPQVVEVFLREFGNRETQ
jgi:PAS domain S-box-containing protein/putative nucleotidyltransferase with HDIG domain